MSRLFRTLAMGAVVLTLAATVSLSSVGAVTAYSLTPFTYVGKAGDCGAGTPAGTPGGVIARWDHRAGNPAPSLVLAKNVVLTDCSSAGATVNGVSGITLTELNFDYQGYCGAGSPRFNVVTSDNATHFFGCAGGTKSKSTINADWTNVVFTSAQGYDPIPAGVTVKSISLIQDEQGQTHIDNVSVNGQVIGGPNTPATMDDCKNGGWQTMQDADGNPFKNQGQCVSSFNHEQGRGNGDQDNNNQGDNGNNNGHNDGGNGNGNGNGGNGRQGNGG